MALSAFDNPDAPPSPPALRQALGPAAPAWTALKRQLLRDCAPLEERWAFAGAKFGWSLRLIRGTRVIVYLTPGNGSFLASFSLGEKACAAAQAARLPASMLGLIERAPKYAEGRGVRIPVRTLRDLAGIRTLVELKLSSRA